MDWYFHRRTHIEEPDHGSVAESLIHSAMFAEGGLPLVLGAAFEMNPMLIALMTGGAVLHELTAMADVRLATKSRRRLSQWEQHVHSFLEVMPFAVIPVMVLLHGPMARNWSLARRSSALRPRDLAMVAAAIVSAGLIPYAEELVRCAKGRTEPDLSDETTRYSPRAAEPVISVTSEKAALAGL